MAEAVKRKLIEVALPLEAINKESAREKSIRHGHPSTLHLWWARRPLAACRAVLFSSLVDDPSSHPDRFPTEEAQQAERQRLFKIIEDMVKWENSTNEDVLAAARAEILNSTGGAPPPVLDPFCGGGSIPLEAQRLGLEAQGSDLNPVAVMISKALVEIPPKFAGRSPVRPDGKQGEQSKLKLNLNKTWNGAQGMAEDVRHYGLWMRNQAIERIGHLYPKAKLPAEAGGGETTVIAWLWMRTVKCPNPACGITMPLVRSFTLSSKKGKQAWVEASANAKAKRMSFTVKTGAGKVPEGTVNRRGAKCLGCEQPVNFEYIRSEAKAGRISAQLMAIVGEGAKGRVYLNPTADHESITEIEPSWQPDTSLPEKALGFRVQAYGMVKHADLFTSRQLTALTTFSDLVQEARKKVLHDAVASGLADDGVPLDQGGSGATAYAEAIGTYLALAIDKCADYWSSICSWHAGRDTIRNVFARHAIPMVWDFAEANPVSDSTGNFSSAVNWIAQVVQVVPASVRGKILHQDATTGRINGSCTSFIVSTDPPYYDNIGYADLADFFYVWLRRSLVRYYPEIFSTMLVPKAAELVATPYRFSGDKQQAKEFFEKGLATAFRIMHDCQNHDYPLTVYYAFKQSEAEKSETQDNDVDEDLESESESESNTVSSTGWETMLSGLIQAGFAINGTWPMRSELSNRMVASGTNALASSIVLVCRQRATTAGSISKRDFVSILKSELPQRLRELQHGNIAPVDLAQAAIGPGMAVFSRYGKVIEASGNAMSVKTALQIINQILDEVLSEQDSDYDADTRWAISWFEQHGFEEGQFGVAEVLSKAKDTSVSGLVEAGILESKAGKVKLMRADELDPNWDPATDKRLTVWEISHYLIRGLETGGKSAAADLMTKVGSKAETALELAYRLYGICERKKWAQEALSYNGLVVSWTEIKAAAAGLDIEPRQLQTSDA